MSLDRVKERIRRLLAVAKDDASADGEIENAIHAARNLMLEHHLEESDIPGEEQIEVQMTTINVTTSSSRKQQWETSLARFCRDFIGHIGYYIDNENARTLHNGRVKEVRQFVFYGEAEGCELAAELYSDLHDTVITMANLQYGSPTKGEARNYAEGFVSGLFTKLKKADERSSSSGTALVVMATKQEEAKSWLAQDKGIKLTRARTSARRVQYSQSAFSQGVSDGQSQSVSRERKAKLTTQRRLT